MFLVYLLAVVSTVGCQGLQPAPNDGDSEEKCVCNPVVNVGSQPCNFDGIHLSNLLAEQKKITDNLKTRVTQLEERIRSKGTHCPAGSWTNWFNRDLPSGNHDNEGLTDLRQDYPGQICDTPTAVHARVTSTQQDAFLTGQHFSSYDTTAGFICTNADQSDGICLDYEVRFCCPAMTTNICMDNHYHCPSWATRGFCTQGTSRYAYMMRYCRKSCRKCTTEGTGTGLGRQEGGDSAPSPTTIPGYTERKGAYYKVVTQAMTYNDAEQACIADGGHLVHVKTQELQDFLVSLIQEAGAGGDIWIGLRKTAEFDTWAWSDGSPVDVRNYTNWAPGEPGNKACVQLWRHKGFRWDDTPCHWRKKFVCQKDCPRAGYVRYNGVCYKSFTERQTYDQAKQVCEADGGTLAMPKDNDTNTFLANLEELVNGRWIGLTDANNDDQWVYEDGQTLTSSGYSNWLPGEPRPWSNDRGDCVGFWEDGPYWNEKPCSKLRGFICQFQEECRDTHRHCEDWARRGECTRNPNYMHVRCRPSCRLCSTGGGGGGGGTGGTGGEGGDGDGGEETEMEEEDTDEGEEEMQEDCGMQYLTESPGIDRIVGGKVAVQGAWPWMAFLYRKNRGFFCGGTLISSRWVVTAAHCFKGKSVDEIEVYLGKHHKHKKDPMEQRFSAEKLILHKGHSGQGRTINDIALIKLPRRAMLTEIANLACLPDGNMANTTQDGSCVTTGWGDTLGTGGEGVLKQLFLPLIPTQTCNSTNFYNGIIDTSMLCAGFEEGGQDSCQGDSGGPLVCSMDGRWYLMGITSWGERCALPKRPGVYARVSEFSDWIEEMMLNN